MKSLKYIVLVLTLAIISGCESYDDYNTDRPTVVGFTTKNKNINGIAPGTSKSSTIDVYASDVSSQDRTFNVISIEITNPDEYPISNPENYSFDSTVVIPANEQIGTVTVTGKNISLTTNRTYFRLAVESSGNVIAGGYVTVGIKQ